MRIIVLSLGSLGWGIGSVNHASKNDQICPWRWPLWIWLPETWAQCEKLSGWNPGSVHVIEAAPVLFSQRELAQWRNFNALKPQTNQSGRPASIQPKRRETLLRKEGGSQCLIVMPRNQILSAPRQHLKWVALLQSGSCRDIQGAAFECRSCAPFELSPPLGGEPSFGPKSIGKTGDEDFPGTATVV